MVLGVQGLGALQMHRLGVYGITSSRPGVYCNVCCCAGVRCCMVLGSALRRVLLCGCSASFAAHANAHWQLCESATKLECVLRGHLLCPCALQVAAHRV
jgi:hypothetical protein